MPNIEFIIYGDINQNSGGYYYDRQLINELQSRGHLVTVTSVPYVKNKINKTDLYIIDELCHPDFYKKKHFNNIRKDVPIVAMVHHLAADEKLNAFDKVKHLMQERNFLRSVDFAIFNSYATEQSARTKGQYSRKSVIAVPGRDTSGGGVISKSSGPLSCIFLGNLIPRKGIHHVLKALVAIRDSNFFFTIAGDNTVDPAYTKKLNKLIKLGKLKDKVVMSGMISDDRKHELLKNADLMLMPSSHEGYGIAYIEAMGHGVIPVAGKSGGAGEIIRHGENGFLVGNEIPSELIKIIKQMQEDPVRKYRIRENALRTWKKHPLWKETFKSAITALENLIDQNF